MDVERWTMPRLLEALEATDASRPGERRVREERTGERGSVEERAAASRELAQRFALGAAMVALTAAERSALELEEVVTAVRRAIGDARWSSLPSLERGSGGPDAPTTLEVLHTIVREALNDPNRDASERGAPARGARVGGLDRHPGEERVVEHMAGVFVGLLLEAELQRRGLTRPHTEQRTPVGPTRPMVMGAVMLMLEGAGHEGSAAWRVVRHVQRTIREAAALTPPGRERVARVLREAVRLGGDEALWGAPRGAAGPRTAADEPARPAGAHAVNTGTPTEVPVERALRPWVACGVALQLLTGGAVRGGGTAGEVDVLTRAASVRATRILYASDRQDPRVDAAAWALEIDGSRVADLLDAAVAAEHAWAVSGRPEGERAAWAAWRWARRITTSGDTWRVLGPPHGQVRERREARAAAADAGGLLVPCVFPVHPRLRGRTTAALWRYGAPAIGAGRLGLPVYPGGGDPRVRWEATPHPLGVLCAVVVRPEELLRLHRKDAVEDERRFAVWAAEASRRARRGAGAYPELLREVLRAHGIRAVARFDLMDGEERAPQEVVVLESSADVLLFVAESFPLPEPPGSGHRGRTARGTSRPRAAMRPS